MFYSISKIASGQFIAQLILLISLPFITRYYNPENFGIFSVFSAIAWILVSFSTGKLEALIITMETKNKSVALTTGLLTVILFFSFSLALISGLFSTIIFPDLLLSSVHLSIFIGLTVFFIGGAQTLRCYVTYLGRFSGHGIAAILNSVGVVFVSLWYAIFVGGNSLFVGLILGQIVGHSTSFFIFLYYSDILRSINIDILKSSFYLLVFESKKIPVLLLSQLFSTLSARLSTLIIFTVGGVASVGSLAIAERIVSAPTNIFGQSVGQVVRYRYSQIYKNDKKNIIFPRKIISFSSLLVVVTYGLIIVLAPWFVPLILGEKWEGAVVFVKLIAAMELFNFIFYTVEDIAIIRNNYFYRMWIHLIQLSLLVSVYLFLEMEVFSISVEMALTLICLIRIVFVVYDLSRTWRKMV
jgi:O-antigen/teichoic acid export membrane protein